MQQSQAAKERKTFRGVFGAYRKWIRAALSVATVVIVCFVLKKTTVVRFYPMCVCALFLVVFGSTLLPIKRRGKVCEPFVFRLACLQDSSITSLPYKDEVRRYCRKVTAVWCVFFVVNGSVAAATALWASDRVWAIYNGIVSYILMGLMFAVEMLIRRRVNKALVAAYAEGRKESKSADASDK